MMTKLLLCSACLLFLSLPLHGEGVLDDVQRILNGQLDVRGMNAETRTRYIEAVRKLAESGDRNAKRQAQTALINLGDTETIEAVMREFSSASGVSRKNAFRSLRHGCRNAGMLPRLAERLFLEEGTNMEVVNAEFYLPRQSVVAAETMREIIIRSSTFPSNVTAWAESLDTKDSKATRSSMRLWWSQNASLVQEELYAATRPPIQEDEHSGTQDTP